MALSDAFGTQVNAAWLALAAGTWPIVQWSLTALREMRADHRSSKMEVGTQMATLIGLLQEELDRTNRLRVQFANQLEQLRAARWTMDDMLTELRDQTIAARAMVHERERAMGVAETPFPPLPPPIAVIAKSADASTESGRAS